jgi:hypothetical protein
MTGNPSRPWHPLAAIAASLAAHVLVFFLLFTLPWAGEPLAREIPETEVSLVRLTASLDQPPDLDPVFRADLPPGSSARIDVEVKMAGRVGPSVPAAPPVLPGDRDGGRAAVGGAKGGGSPLAAPAGVRGVVYLLDRSASMGLHGAWEAARRETVAQLRRLPPGTRFQVVPYNRQADPLVLGGSRGLVPAGPAVVEEAARALAWLAPSGSTDHVGALRRGLALGPDALFLVTDAGDLTSEEVAAVTAFNRGRTAIHTVEVTDRSHPRPDGPLARLAAQNGGTCRILPPQAGLAAAP